MKKPYNEKDELDCQDDNCQDIESCDCQGICTCQPGLEFDEAADDCDNCCCSDDEDDDCDEYDLDTDPECMDGDDE